MKSFAAIFSILLCSSIAYGENVGQSILKKTQISTGMGCVSKGVSWEVGQEKARIEAVERAQNDALTKTATYLKTYSRTESKRNVKNIKEARSIGRVELLEPPIFSDPVVDREGYCTTATIKASVTVDEKLLKDIAAGPEYDNDPNAPLNVRVSTEKMEYRDGEKIIVKVVANKDFYLELIYIDANKKRLQLIPNEYRSQNFFKGGQVHILPADKKEFEIEVDCNEANGTKCGEEMIIANVFTHKPQFNSEKGDTPTEGQNFPEYTGDIKTRGAKLSAGTLYQDKQRPSIEVSSAQSNSSTVVFYTSK